MFAYSSAVHRATEFSGEKMKRIIVLALSLLVAASVFAQDQSSTDTKSRQSSGSATRSSSDMKELKDAIAAQQQQIQQLQHQIQSRDTAIQTLEQRVSQAEAS